MSPVRRDGTVAVEDVSAWLHREARKEADRGHHDAAGAITMLAVHVTAEFGMSEDEREAVDVVAEFLHTGGPSLNADQATTEELERDCERIAEARQAMHPRYGAQGDA